MTFRFYDLRSTRDSDDVVAAWLDGLRVLTPFLKVVSYPKKEAATWALWSGDPFLLVGSKDDLNQYFGRLEDLEREVLRDHRYYWCLTEEASYRHSSFADDLRPIILAWRAAEQNVVNHRLQLLQQFPRLKGLGKRMHLIREEIQRISAGPTSPGYPVLILGDSGVGKEEVAQSLIEASNRKGQPVFPITGAWMNADAGLARSELLGIRGHIATGVAQSPGLLHDASKGTLFFDDFESAPRYIQEMLLRLMATRRGEPALYKKVGDSVYSKTSAWLIFATNANVDKLLKTEQLREDVLYRFEDRVLVIPPLRHRPADFPAITLKIWADLWSHEPTRAIPLGLSVIRQISSAELRLEGNVRTLRALLGFVVSMRCNPAHNDASPGQLIEQVLLRGKTYKEWLGLYDQEFYYGGNTAVDDIKRADAGSDCQGSARKGPTDAVSLVPSERRARELLTKEGWNAFWELVALARGKRSNEASDHIGVSVRLARIVVYVATNGPITWKVAAELSDVVENTAVKDLASLANFELRHPRKRILRSQGKAVLSEKDGVYVKNGVLFA